MPFTPYHFGPGLLIKAAVPTRFSFTAYAVAQVVIDLESGYYLFSGQTPVHRTLHTFVVGGAIGLIAGVASGVVGQRMFGRSVDGVGAGLQSEFRIWPSAWGGLIGGLMHSLLDGVMHADIRPFRPFSDDNPLFRVIELLPLHLACIACGMLGAFWLSQRKFWEVTG